MTSTFNCIVISAHHIVALLQANQYRKPMESYSSCKAYILWQSEPAVVSFPCLSWVTQVSPVRQKDRKHNRKRGVPLWILKALWHPAHHGGHWPVFERDACMRVCAETLQSRPSLSQFRTRPLYIFNPLTGGNNKRLFQTVNGKTE